MVGCQPADQAATSPRPENAPAELEAEGHGDHDELAELVPLLDKHCATLRDSMAADDHPTADEAMHEIAHLAQHLDDAGQEAGLEAGQLAELKKAAEQLFQAVGKVHAGAHGGDAEPVAYDDIAADVDAALAKLRELADAAGAGRDSDGS